MYVFVEFHISGNFFRNCPVGDELPSGDTCCSSCFPGSFKEPPGDEHRAARRHKQSNLVSGFLMNCLVVMNTRQATRMNLARF